MRRLMRSPGRAPQGRGGEQAWLWIAGMILPLSSRICEMASVHAADRIARIDARRSDDPRAQCRMSSRSAQVALRDLVGRQQLPPAARGRERPCGAVVARPCGGRRAAGARRARRRGRATPARSAWAWRGSAAWCANISRSAIRYYKALRNPSAQELETLDMARRGDPRPRHAPADRGAGRQGRNRLRHRAAALHADLRAAYQSLTGQGASWVARNALFGGARAPQRRCCWQRWPAAAGCGGRPALDAAAQRVPGPGRALRARRDGRGGLSPRSGRSAPISPISRPATGRGARDPLFARQPAQAAREAGLKIGRGPSLRSVPTGRAPGRQLHDPGPARRGPAAPGRRAFATRRRRARTGSAKRRWRAS